jgi:organic hydroperoxide reductase OsmC/OhrA
MSATPPLRFQVNVSRRGPIDATVEAAPRAVIRGGPPPEFGGDEAHWSPEHLLVASAALCFWNTLEWFARRVSFTGLECRAEGEVAKTGDGLAFSGVRLEVVATTTPDQEPALRELIEVAKKSCLVARSLACPVELAATVMTDAPEGEQSRATGWAPPPAAA